MSYEAWGDDDDGLDNVRETYRKVLLEDGWLDDEAADRLRAEKAELAKALQAVLRVPALGDARLDDAQEQARAALRRVEGV